MISWYLDEDGSREGFSEWSKSIALRDVGLTVIETKHEELTFFGVGFSKNDAKPDP